MSSFLIISIQYKLTMILAKELGRQAREIKKLSTGEMEETKQAIAQAWTGENSVRYIQKLGTLEQKITNNAAGLETSASSIQKMAQNVYEAEQIATEIARRGF